MNQEQAYAELGLEKPMKTEKYKEALRQLKLSMANVQRAGERLARRGANIRTNPKRKKAGPKARKGTAAGGGQFDREAGTPSVQVAG